jgi:hypothetical protein
LHRGNGHEEILEYLSPMLRRALQRAAIVGHLVQRIA